MESEQQPKLISPLGHVLCVVATVLFFVFMWDVCKSHVMSFDTETQALFAIIPAWSLAATFYIGVNCFAVTFADQRRRRKSR